MLRRLSAVPPQCSLAYPRRRSIEYCASRNKSATSKRKCGSPKAQIDCVKGPRSELILFVEGLNPYPRSITWAAVRRRDTGAVIVSPTAAAGSFKTRTALEINDE